MLLVMANEESRAQTESTFPFEGRRIVVFGFRIVRGTVVSGREVASNGAPQKVLVLYLHERGSGVSVPSSRVV